MHFRVRQNEGFKDDWLVEAVEPKAGNDTALIAVFNHQVSAQALADILNRAAALRGDILLP